MSLIVTSNTQDEYKEFDHRGDGVTGSKMGIENPSDYHNHLSSPLEVEKNSQIAVQSVKFTRNALSQIEGENLLYYFGRELGSALELKNVDSRPELITIAKGTYNRQQFADQLKKELNFSCNPPAVFNDFDVSVSLVGKDFGGYKITAIQRGATFADKKAIMTNHIANIPIDVGVAEYPISDNYTYSGNVISRTGGNVATFDNKAVAILTDCPFATQNGSTVASGGETTFDFSNTSGVGAGGVARPWRIGLTRPTLLTNEKGFRSAGTDQNTGCSPPDWRSLANPFAEEILPFWDYVVSFDGSAINVYQACYFKDANGNPEENSFTMRHVQYWGGTNQTASQILVADMYDTGKKYKHIAFEAYGDEIALWISAVGGEDPADWTALLGARSGGDAVNASRVFKPVSSWTSALYPKIEICGGKIEMTKYDSYSVKNTDYKYPTLTGADADRSSGVYNVGDSPYSNVVARMPSTISGKHTLANERPCWAFQSGGLILSNDRADSQMIPSDVSSTVNPYFVTTNPDQGVAYEHILILEPTSNGQDEIGDYKSDMCNISKLLGFPNVAVLDESYGTVTASNRVDWYSVEVPLFSVNSAFIRLLNTTQRSYNACKNSVSKILYHVPRFTNDGRQDGELFFEPNERVYIDFGNTERFVMNQFQVQICDKNERVINDLEGETIVVFHVRKKAEFGQYE